MVASTTALNVPEGNSATFTVVLTAQPLSNTDINIARTSGATNLTVTSGTTLTFTTNNWSAPQVVSVSAAEDPNAVSETAAFTLSSAGLADKVRDRNICGQRHSWLVGHTVLLNVAEAGTNQFSVALTAQPTNNVIVTTTRASGSTNLTVSAGGTLTFTPGNWNTPQPVTLASAHDANAVNDFAVFTIASTGLGPKTITATQIDDDVLDMALSTATLSAPEGGSTNYTVVLTAQPTNNLVITTSWISGSTNLTVSGGGTLTFTPANWNSPQPVSISAANDADALVDVAVFTSTSFGLANRSVTVSSLEKDVLTLLVSTSAVAIPEGTGVNMTVFLSAQPTGTVTVTTTRTSGSTNLTVTVGATLNFTAGNWNTPQTITVNSTAQPDIINDTAVFTIASAGLPSAIVNATEQDATILGITALPSSLNVAEGGTNQFTLALTAIPTNNITVTTTRTSGSANLNLIAGGTLTFTTGNWNVPQTVTVTSTAAPDIVNDVATFTATSAGVASQSVTVTEVDANALNFVVTPASLSWPEGGSTNFTVVLTAQPTNNVTVTTARTSGSANLNVTAGAALTFTVANWNTPQPVTLTSTTQPDIVNDTAAFTVSSTGMANQTVNATELDQTVMGLSASTSAVSVTEGTTTSFTVTLTAIPTNTITVTTSRTSGSTNLSVTAGGHPHLHRLVIGIHHRRSASSPPPIRTLSTTAAC